MKLNPFFVLLILIATAIVALEVADAYIKENITCSVIELKEQQIYSKSGDRGRTKYRFIVVTDSETFVVENSVLNFKFNNSDVFYRLKKGETYKFKVCGIGKSLLTDYRNVLSIE